MTRPNELKQLDEELAAGRLSPAEYLRRRDELMPGAEQTERPPTSSNAPGGTADKPGDIAGTPGGTTDDTDAAPEASPFPPAFNWESSRPNESTQVIYPAQGDTDQEDHSDTTQVVRRGDDHDSERTQVVQASAAPYQPLPEVPMRQEQSAYQQDLNHGWSSHESAPPWVSTDLPPSNDPQSGWMLQGPEFFEASPERSNRKQIIGLSVVAVLVLALMGAGVAYFLSRGTEGTEAGGGDQITQQPNQPLAPSAVELPAPPNPLPPPADTAQALIEPPGQARGGGGLFDLPQLEGRKLVPDPVISALRTGAMTDGVLKTTTEGPSTIGMFAFTLPNERVATTVAETIATVQLTGGLQQDNDRSLQGVAVLGSAPGASPNVHRAVYVLYDRAIFFEVFGSDREAVLSTFDSILDEQLAHAPPTFR
ncbi:MAG: hypothetical protein ACRDTC_08690 [Pseudonocardiaceae bacterium]